MAQPATPTTTTTVGYFNGHKFPIHLSISALNITMRLGPGEFIVDRDQRKINDPYLDRYAGKNQLSKETSKKPVPLLLIPTFATARPATGESSVRQVTEFVQEGKFVRRPVLPPPANVPIPTENASSYRAMSMDEARKLGFVHKTRDVPEDFGATETQNGRPAGAIPEIKYATDMGPSSKTKALPATVVQPVLKATVPVPPKRKALPAPAPAPAPAPVIVESAPEPAAEAPKARVIAGRRRTVQPVTPAPVESDSPFGNTLVTNVTPPDLTSEEPDLEDTEQAADVGESEEPQQEEAEETSEGAAQPQKFVCLKDGQMFDTREGLAAHIQANFPRQMKALMSAYPEP